MNAPRLPYYVVDAFTDVPFRGNPAAVCLEADDLDDEARQHIAREMNLSETAFVYRPDGNGERRLRWFTPAVEVPLCGHATLASAHVLLREAGGAGPLVFRSASGRLRVREDGSRLVLDLPSDPPVVAPMPAGLPEALGLAAGPGPRKAGGSGEDARAPGAGPVAGAAAEEPPRGEGRESRIAEPPVPGATPVFMASGKVAVVALAAEEEVAELRPDFGALGRVELPAGLMGVAVTAPGAAAAVDFVSRFFGPWVGVDEDPVTGVAHTALAPYWAAALGKTEMAARQRSARGGELVVRALGERVELAGGAATVASGSLVRPSARAPKRG